MASPFPQIRQITVSIDPVLDVFVKDEIARGLGDSEQNYIVSVLTREHERHIDRLRQEKQSANSIGNSLSRDMI